jgi:hypothetical protein
VSNHDSALERFKAFVSEILTVSKEDAQKAEADRQAVLRPQPPAKRKKKDSR